MRSLTDNSPDILTRHDRQMRCVFVNSAVILVTGAVPATYIGKTARECGMPEALCTIWEAAMQQVFDNGRSHRFEFELTHSNATRHFECRMVPENGSGVPVQYVIGVSHDITERRRQAVQREALLVEEQAARTEAERVGLIKVDILAYVNEGDSHCWPLMSERETRFEPGFLISLRDTFQPHPRVTADRRTRLHRITLRVPHRTMA